MNSFFKDKVSLAGACLERSKKLPEIEADLYLLSSNDVLMALERKLKDRRFVISRRTLDPSKLGPLFKIRPGTPVLVVNNAKDVTLDTVELLKKFGLDSLELIPWWPGASFLPETVEVAITPGFTSLVPASITQVHDLGIRPIDVSTLVEISLLLGLPLEGVHHATAANYQGITKIIREQLNLLEAVESSRRDLEVILDNVHDAVIMSDFDGNIKKINNAAKKMIGLGEPEIFNYNLRRWFSEGIITRVKSTGVSEVNVLQTIRGKKYLVTVTPIEEQEPRLIAIAREAGSIERARGDLARAMKIGVRRAKYSFEDIIASSPAMKKAVNVAKKLAATTTTVLITGETGTGKELFAQAIHNASPRKNKPFIAQNIAALPEQLIQSELFGYESGAFTGARREGKPGLFELADGGTIFLDEIAEISPSVQISLLRVLQEREVTRVGGSNLIPIDVRVIAATNRDLWEAVREGRFRKDLYYRLCAFPLRIPPLRERKEDIPLLARYFAAKYSPWDAKLPLGLVRKLQDWSWPGNVRELEELIKYSASISDSAREFFFNIEEYLEKIPSRGPSLQSESLAEIADYLCDHGDMLEFRAILECLRQVPLDQGMGRGSLAQVISSRTNLTLTSGQIRSRLELLTRAGLTETFKGRRGTRLTALGRKFLSYLSQLDK